MRVKLKPGVIDTRTALAIRIRSDLLDSIGRISVDSYPERRIRSWGASAVHGRHHPRSLHVSDRPVRAGDRVSAPVRASHLVPMPLMDVDRVVPGGGHGWTRPTERSS